MEIKTVGIVGCGQMGGGIVEVVAKAGYQVITREINQELLDKGLEHVRKSMDRAVRRGKLSEGDRDAALGRIHGTLDLADFKNADIVIEAIIERMDLKKSVFGELSRVCPPETIFASNTSSLNLAEIAASTDRPNQFLGIHFFNPAPVMPLVEIVRALATSDETLETAQAFVNSLGKSPILAKDAPGFVVNRLLIPYLVDAIRVYEQGLASRDDIDKGMKLGAGHPMGPLELCDYVGLDTMLYVADVLHDELGDPWLAAPPLLRRMVAGGYLGRKSGKGFYDYNR